MCDEAGRCSARAKLASRGAHRPRIERSQRGLRNKHLVRLCRLGKARGDVHIYSEVVAANLARAPKMDSGTQLRTVTADIHRRHSIARVEGRLGRAGRIAEDRHQTIAEPLYHLAASRQDRRLDRLADLAQELDGELIASLQRPLGKAHEIREEDRDIHLATTPTLSLGKPLPALQHGRSQFSRNTGLLGPERRELAECDIGGAAANARQSVLDLFFAKRPLTRLACGAQQLGAAVESTRGPGEPPRATGAGRLAHGASLNNRARGHSLRRLSESD